MKTQVEELPDNRVRLVVEVPAGDVDHALDHALTDLGRGVRVPGFRKGKAPKPILIQRLGRAAVIQEALDGHLGSWYSRAVAVSGIDPVDRPTIDWEDEPSEGAPFNFSAEVEVKPPPEVSGYKGLEVQRDEPPVPTEAIDAELERLRLSVAQLNPVEREARPGDFVVIDFTGSLDGTEFEGGKGTDYGIELGSGRLVADLERGLEGMRTGESREIDVTFPDDYPAENLAGRTAQFAVTVKDVKERLLPELDDEFARQASEFDTLAELREDITRRITEAVEAETQMRFRGMALDALAGNLTSEVPATFVQSRMQEMARGMADTLRSRGFTLQDYLQATGQSGEQVIEAMRPQAEDAVRKDLVLEAVANAENIEVSDERLEEWVREQAANSGEDADGAVERLLGDPATRTALRTDLRLQKALDVVVENAKPITAEQAQARAALWTPEKESAEKPETQMIWTPGSGPEPAREKETQ
jgi:trigger factor